MNLCISNVRDSRSQNYTNGGNMRGNNNLYQPEYQNEVTKYINTCGSHDMKGVSSFLGDGESIFSIKDKKKEEAKPRHFITNVSMNEADFLPLDTCNSNCREGPLMQNQNHRSPLENTHYSYNNHINHCEGEKKFISELHINIKDPMLDEKDTKYVYNDIRNNCKEAEYPKYSTMHSSHLLSYVGENQYEFDDRDSYSPDNRSNSFEVPNQKRECHHSEKFIYLGGDSRSGRKGEPLNYELRTCQSPVELQEDSSDRSEESVIDDSSKSFSSKSIQTSRKIDCIFKLTHDKCVETDFPLLRPEIGINDKLEIRKRGNHEYLDQTPSSTSSDDIDVEYNESTDEREPKCKSSQDSTEKPNINYYEPPERNLERPSHAHNNQETDIDSYTDSFHYPKKEKKEIKNEKPLCSKPTVRRPEQKKISRSSVNSRLNLKEMKLHERIKSSDSIRNNMVKEVKSSPNTKVESERHSYEIQCLLDNLNIHLQNTVNSQKSKVGCSKTNNNHLNSTSSFWDNPLNPETSRSLFLNRDLGPKTSEMNNRKSVNPEIQAIFETLGKSNRLPDKAEVRGVIPKHSPKPELNSRIQKLGTMNINECNTMKHSSNVSEVDNLTEIRFPPNLKFQKSFELNPYDELVKSHLNSVDRRIKSVASKNGCQIVIDGPISLIDPSSTCQAIRNKIAYNCTIAGSSKDRLEKCLNYLKETFPNTCLRLHNRNNLTPKT